MTRARIVHVAMGVWAVWIVIAGFASGARPSAILVLMALGFWGIGKLAQPGVLS